MRFFTPALPLALAASAFAQTDATAQTNPACDANAIRWFIPGTFEKALAKARADKRLLVIKGISFGVDDIGAKCATKGKW